jgi:hypothetical protein
MNNPASTTTHRPLRLATLTMLTVSIAVTLTVLLHLALVSHFSHKQARKEAQLRLQQLSWQMRDSLNRVTSNAIVTVKLLADLPQVRSVDDPDATRHVLESIQREVADYAWIGVADANGKVRAATGGMLEGAQVSARPWFQDGLKGVHATDYHPAALLNKLLPKAADPWRFIDMSAPLPGDDGKPAGVVGVHMSWQWVRNRAAQLFTPALREYGAEVLVVRADGLRARAYAWPSPAPPVRCASRAPTEKSTSPATAAPGRPATRRRCSGRCWCATPRTRRWPRRAGSSAA